MGRSRVVLLSWVVVVALIGAVVLRFVDQFNLVATPPQLPDTASLVEHVLGSAAYRQAIWPVYLLTNLLFFVGFIAVAVFGAVVASALQGRRPVATFAALLAVGGILGGISALIAVGGVEAGVWLQYCDCGFKDTEVVSQAWAQMVTLDIGNWLLRGAGVVLGVGAIALVREAGEVVPSALRIWSYLTAIALVAAPIVGFVGRFDPVPDLLTTLIAGILVPVWVIWLGRSVDRAAEA